MKKMMLLQVAITHYQICSQAVLKCIYLFIFIAVLLVPKMPEVSQIAFMI